LTKFRHPTLLNLLEAPIEDNKTIAFVSEPVLFNLASLAFDSSKRDLIPSEVDLKCIVLELMECVNFLHANAKTIHLNLAPEHLYITAEGKLKVGGLNLIQQFSTADPVGVSWNFLQKVGDFAMVPNLRFSAPEVTESQNVTAQSDIFSIGCLIYFLVQLNKQKSGNQLFVMN